MVWLWHKSAIYSDKKFLKQSGYKPNLVILQFCVNDFMNNSYEWDLTENFNQFLRRPF